MKNYKLLTPGPLTTTDTVKQEMLFDYCTWDDDYKEITQKIRKELLKLAVDRLDDREKRIVELRFGLNREDGEEMTQKEVADLMGISQSYISRLEKKIMKRLRREIIKFV